MMYRAKITHCAPIIENIYGKDYPYIVKDKHDHYIEVKDETEANYIDYINECQRKTFDGVKKLQDYREIIKILKN